MRLLLQQAKHPEVDMRFVAQQLEGRKQASAKWPTLAVCDDWLFPPKLNREQSSSEAAARHKAEIAARLGCRSLADLTGGMGIDTLFLASGMDEVHYVEIDPDLCGLARHNFAALNQPHIHCHTADSMQWIGEQPKTFDLLFIDPARRDSHGHKVAAFEVCTPSLLPNLDTLLRHGHRLMVKASPMIDLRQALRELGHVEEAHIVAVDGECKEVLFLVGQQDRDPQIHCTDLRHGKRWHNSFRPSEEQSAQPRYCSTLGSYLYEPNAALMKGGPYASICQWYGIEQLARNTHLYTSSTRVEDFPGRVFRILGEMQLNAKTAAAQIADGKAHVAVRNFPMEAADLQRKLKLREGGDMFVIATTLGTKPIGLLCKKA